MRRWTRAAVGFAVGFGGTAAAIAATELAGDQRTEPPGTTAPVGLTETDLVAYCEETLGPGSVAILVSDRADGWSCLAPGAVSGRRDAPAGATSSTVAGAATVASGGPEPTRAVPIDLAAVCRSQVGPEAVLDVIDDASPSGWRCGTPDAEPGASSDPTPDG